jgi:hypothetical protein
MEALPLPSLIALLSLLVAAASFGMSAWYNRKKVKVADDAGYVLRLEGEVRLLNGRVSSLEQKHEECERDRRRLERENVDLLRRLVRENH